MSVCICNIRIQSESLTSPQLFVIPISIHAHLFPILSLAYIDLHLNQWLVEIQETSFCLFSSLALALCICLPIWSPVYKPCFCFVFDDKFSLALFFCQCLPDLNLGLFDYFFACSPCTVAYLLTWLWKLFWIKDYKLHFGLHLGPSPRPHSCSWYRPQNTSRKAGEVCRRVTRSEWQ